MNSTRRGLGGRTIIGIFLVILGSLFLLSKFEIVDFFIWQEIFSFPTILIVIGAIIILNSNDAAGYILVLIGGVFLLSRHYGFNPWEFWPVLLVFLGLYILFHSRRAHHIAAPDDKHSRRFADSVINDDYIDEVAVFGGGKRSVRSKNFKGGKATAIFGGIELDLYEANLAPGENTIDLLACFGGITLFIPRDWKVIVKITPIFGGVNDERRKDPNMVYTDDKVLVIKGLVLFGGGEIKTA